MLLLLHGDRHDKLTIVMSAYLLPGMSQFLSNKNNLSYASSIFSVDYPDKLRCVKEFYDDSSLVVVL